MRREKTGDNFCRFVQFAKQILAISLAVHGFHAGWSHPSVTYSPVKGSLIIALTNLLSKLSTTGKQWAIYHKSSRRYRYVFDFILVMIHGK